MIFIYIYIYILDVIYQIYDRQTHDQCMKCLGKRWAPHKIGGPGSTRNREFDQRRYWPRENRPRTGVFLIWELNKFAPDYEG